MLINIGDVYQFIVNCLIPYDPYFYQQQILLKYTYQKMKSLPIFSNDILCKIYTLPFRLIDYITINEEKKYFIPTYLDILIII